MTTAQQKKRSLIIGIAGGSGSGKTHLTNQIQKQVGGKCVATLRMDQYFCTEPNGDIERINFDHPAHLNMELILRHLHELREGKSVKAPSYDFRTMLQIPEQVFIPPCPVIIVEGLFVLAKPIVDFFDLTCFLDVEVDQRLLGRILRDLEEREATIEKIVDRYQRFVRPSYHIFVAPTMQNADIVVDFTYRRAFFTKLLVNWIESYAKGVFNLEEFVQELRSESYRLGYKPQQSVMPMSIDIRELAKAYPEYAYPEAVPEAPPEHPKLFLQKTIEQEQSTIKRSGES